MTKDELERIKYRLEFARANRGSFNSAIGYYADDVTLLLKKIIDTQENLSGDSADQELLDLVKDN